MYNRYELAKSLKEFEERAERGELKVNRWADKEKIRRSGRYVTKFDYV